MDLLAAIPGAAICTVLMLPMLTSLPLVLDEHGTWWITGDGPLNLWRRSLEYENIPPLAPAIHWLFISILGKSEFAFRLPVALLTIAAVIVTSLVGTRFSDRRLGLIAGIVLALHPDVLNETRIARCYALSLLLAALLLLAVLKWLRYPTRPGGPLLWTITDSGLVWTHYLNFPVVAISLIMLLLSVRIPVTSHRGWLLLPIGITGISILPLLPAIYRMFVWGSLFEFQQSATLNEVLSGMWWCGLPLALTLRLFIRSTRVDPESSRCSHQIIWLTVLFVGLPTLATLGNPRTPPFPQPATADLLPHCSLALPDCRTMDTNTTANAAGKSMETGCDVPEPTYQYCRTDLCTEWSGGCMAPCMDA
jgi:4-amino-4-deoxy-L-arabinose transferase-like glycosyltransferase